MTNAFNKYKKIIYKKKRRKQKTSTMAVIFERNSAYSGLLKAFAEWSVYQSAHNPSYGIQ